MAEADETIVGIHSVSEALAGGESVRRIAIAQHRQNDPALKEIVNEAKRRGIAIKIEPESFFRRFGNVRHQHVAATVAAFEPAEWAQLRRRMAGKNDALIVVADHIEDPQNLGAIMRSGRERRAPMAS